MLELEFVGMFTYVTGLQ